MSDNKQTEDLSKYSLIGKIGSLVGVFLVPFYAELISKIGFLPVVVIIGITLSSLYYICFNNMLNETKVEESEESPIDTSENKTNKENDNLEGSVFHRAFSILKNSYKYLDIILYYLLLSITGFIGSNLPFLTKCSHSAYIPILALAFINIKVDKKIKPIVFIPFALLSYYISSPALLCFCTMNYYINFKSKSHAEKKYGDAFIPHITAHLVNDLLFAFLYGCATLYYCIY